MELHIDVPWILQVAELAGADDPQPDDYGVPVAACARHRATMLDRPIYDGPFTRAAALVHTLGRCQWLERSNLAVAAATGVMYLEASGISLKPTGEDAMALRDLLLEPACTAVRIADLLRTWPTAS
ncbi:MULTISPECIES: fic family toxin-antitoxin system, toxin component [unclassified Streptomyces]|uniref:fic family toxin-antitoxin system, toxin component n=1 Tax=unclassified Streptomyces TaxID=2593676 RepID=UPI003327A7F3